MLQPDLHHLQQQQLSLPRSKRSERTSRDAKSGRGSRGKGEREEHATLSHMASAQSILFCSAGRQWLVLLPSTSRRKREDKEGYGRKEKEKVGKSGGGEEDGKEGQGEDGGRGGGSGGRKEQ